MAITWSYGVTTILDRIDTTLPKTLDSLKMAGFDSPHLFVDGALCQELYNRKFGLNVTCRFPAIRVTGNWICSLWELYVKNSHAEFFAIFQDDIIISRGAKEYIENTAPNGRMYFNLYNVPENERLKPPGMKYGWYPSNQYGRGALALVFRVEAVQALLGANHLLNKPRDLERGWRTIDGAVVDSMKQAGYKEVVPFPSIVQHIGYMSTIGTPDRATPRSFRGEEFDLRRLGEPS